jgi:hypothetical protein
MTSVRDIVPITPSPRGGSGNSAVLTAPEPVGSSRRSTLVEDEIAGIVSAVCAKFPGRTHADVEALVRAAHEHLSSSAKVTAHLIPLTLNRSIRLMRESTKRAIDRGEALR